MENTLPLGVVKQLWSKCHGKPVCAFNQIHPNHTIHAELKKRAEEAGQPMVRKPQAGLGPEALINHYPISVLRTVWPELKLD